MPRNMLNFGRNSEPTPPYNNIVNSSEEQALRFIALLREMTATTGRSYRDIFSEAQSRFEEGALRAGGLRECSGRRMCRRSWLSYTVDRYYHQYHQISLIKRSRSSITRTKYYYKFIIIIALLIVLGAQRCRGRSDALVRSNGQNRSPICPRTGIVLAH